MRRPEANVESRARIDLDLVGVRDLVLDRVLDRRDHALVVVELVEGGVERAGLATAGRPDDDHGAEGLVDRAGQGIGGGVAHSELLERDRGSTGVHDPQRHLLAMSRRQHRNTQVDRALTGAERQASVLWGALLGDVELGHHLQAARHRRLEVLRNRCELAHHTVHAGPNEQPVSLGSEVDVGSAEIDCAAKDRVHLLDRGRIRRSLAQVDHRCRRRFLDDRLLVEVELAGIDPGDRSIDRFGRGNPDAYGRSERNPQVVRGHHVRRIADRDEDRTLLEEADRDRAIPPSESLAQQTGGTHVDRLANEVDERKLVLLGEHARHLRRRHEAQVDEQLTEPLAGGLLVIQRLLELLDGERAVAEQKRSQSRPRMCSSFHFLPVIGRVRREMRCNRSAMKAVLQRVSRASVRVEGRVEGEIGVGLLVLLGIAQGDTEADAARLAGKVARLRVFENDEGRLDRSLLDAGGAALVVSQFTLIADTHKGNRPSFAAAAPTQEAEALVEHVCGALRELGVPVETGVFGARMEVELVNDGPVTITLG